MTQKNLNQSTLDRPSIRNKFIAAASFVSMFFIFAEPALAEIKTIGEVTPKYCEIQYSGIRDRIIPCYKYIITYDNNNGSTGHHFFIPGLQDRIMLYSPTLTTRPVGNQSSISFSVDSIMLVSDDEPLLVKGYGRCFMTVSGLSCNFSDYKTLNELTVIIDY